MDRDNYIRRVCERAHDKYGIKARLGRRFGISRERVRQIRNEGK